MSPFRMWAIRSSINAISAKLRANHEAVAEEYRKVERAKADARKMIGEMARSSAVLAQRKARLVAMESEGDWN